jgi:hypothetical protein
VETEPHHLLLDHRSHGLAVAVAALKGQLLELVKAAVAMAQITIRLVAMELLIPEVVVGVVVLPAVMEVQAEQAVQA